MADIIIKGMEMPKTCWNCKLKVGFCACGIVTDHKDGGFFYRVHQGNSRPDWCPLVPLPEGHGRLIDADALAYSAGVRKKGCAYQEEIFNAPTIVPAEGGGEDG